MIFIVKKISLLNILLLFKNILYINIIKKKNEVNVMDILNKNLKIKKILESDQNNMLTIVFDKVAQNIADKEKVDPQSQVYDPYQQ